MAGTRNVLHEFRYRQNVRIGMDGLVAEITHEEQPDERQRLKELRPP